MWDLSRCLGWQEGRLYNAGSGFLNGAWLQPVVSMLAFFQSIWIWLQPAVPCLPKCNLEELSGLASVGGMDS